MAYDTARGRVVLFGGYNGNYLDDTWEWDGTTWTQRATSGPSPRMHPAMAYDTARGRVVLFGGSNGNYLGDTWEWDGTTWTQRATSGPASRYGHAMAYDTARGWVVLFGGYNGNYLGDTWEWDGTTWTQRTTLGPFPRMHPAMAYDTARGRVVLCGGVTYFNNHFVVLGDTWEWDGTTWTRPSTSEPGPRWGHAMAYDTARGRVVLFGGYGLFDVYLGDTWEWDGTTWTQRVTSGPSPRLHHAMAYDTARGWVVLFGGSDGNGDTWEYGDCSTPSVWYRDADGDGFGDPSVAQSACMPPAGYVAVAGDCNDANLEVFPNAEEICDEIDNQCPGDPGFGQSDENRANPALNGADTDGDGLTDCEELYGIDGDGSGTIDLDLKGLGADRRVPDVFVEVDYMSCAAGVYAGEDPSLCLPAHPRHFPDAFALTSIRRVFQRHGVNLRFTNLLTESEPVPERAVMCSVNAELNMYQYGVPEENPDAACSHEDDAFFGTSQERHSANCVGIMRAKHRVYRYALVTHALPGPNTTRCSAAGDYTGISKPPQLGCSSRALMINLGDFASQYTNEAAERNDTSYEQEWQFYQAGVLMHEIGHTLGLLHGGADEEKCKPNYLSVMSYSRIHNMSGSASNMPGIPDGQLVRLGTMDQWLDYSDAALDPLAEDLLNEAHGVGSGACSASTQVPCKVNSDCPSGESCVRSPANRFTIYCGEVWSVGGGAWCHSRLINPVAQPIDWNNDGDESDPDVSQDIDLLGGFWPDKGLNCPGGAQSFQGFDDWKRIRGDQTAHPPVSSCIGLAPYVPGANASELIVTDVLPEEPTLTHYLSGVLGNDDADEDGVPNLDDMCPLNVDPGQQDLDGDGRGDACDCLPSNAGHWGQPSEVRALSSMDHQTLHWVEPAFPGSAGLVFDTLRSTRAQDFVNGVTCVEASDGSDDAAIDGTEPDPGQTFFYLVRAKSACPNGVGSLGTDSSGSTRIGTTCF